MKLAHTILAGAALAVTMATAAPAADLLVRNDPIYDAPLFNFEGLYVGGSLGGALSSTTPGLVVGGVAGANFAITDGIILGGEIQADTYWNGGLSSYDVLALGRVGGFLTDNTMIYGDVGGGVHNNNAVYAVGGGVEVALTGPLSARGDIQAIGNFGSFPTTAKATAGLLWHLN